MKRFYKMYFFGALTVLFFSMTACNKWLDVNPKSEIKQGHLFDTEQGFKDALYGAYTLMAQQSLYGGEMTMGLMSVLAQDYDETNPTSDYYSSAAYNYQDQRSLNRSNAIWDGCYNAIANLNNILEHIDAQKGIFSDGDYNLIKGEALGLRAYIHFDLLRIFAPSYLTGKDKPAIPYITSFSKKVTAVSTVSEVISSALDDLKEAAALLKDDPVTSKDPGMSDDDFWQYRPFHFNLYAVDGLMARINLYMGDKTSALEYAEKVIASGRFDFVTNEAVSAADDQRDRTFSTEQVFALYVYKIGDFVMDHFHQSAGNTAYLTNTDDNTRSLFEVNSGGSTDYRYAYLWNVDGGKKFPSKFWQFTDAPDRLKYRMPLIRLSEMYYIAAECSPGAGQGIKYLNDVRANRGLSDLPDTLNDGQLQDEIYKAYRKEFYAEGQTFYYLKRLNFSGLPGTNVKGSDRVFVLPLPKDEIQYGHR